MVLAVEAEWTQEVNLAKLRDSFCSCIIIFRFGCSMYNCTWASGDDGSFKEAVQSEK